ncbi:MAG: hypothetical protein K2X27_27270, partial [Candidatus Obscuribacterales bacterium]|nr:hypothetical protein [Candidatus Obscuribacterales bacterium]
MGIAQKFSVGLLMTACLLQSTIPAIAQLPNPETPQQKRAKSKQKFTTQAENKYIEIPNVPQYPSQRTACKFIRAL